MQKVTKTIHADAVGCEDLGEARLINTAEFCEVCHSASGFGKRSLQTMPDERGVMGA
ncbi:MAG: hypothetical protein ACR2JR_06565 [Rubrobacteraceae bacterium]